MNADDPTPIRLAADTVTAAELDDLADWMRAGHQLTKGPETVRFEREFADWLGCEHAVFVNSGSSATLLMIDALRQTGRLRNRRAVAPAVSWVTTVAPLLQCGFDVALCDCDARHLGLDLAHLERLLQTHQPALLVLVHVLGHANDMAAIRDLCARHDVALLEDACEALGSVSAGGALGTQGAAGSFSFYFGHQMSTLEGGMVVTDDAELQQTMLSLRSHGWSRDLDPARRAALMERHGVDEVRNWYTFYHAGYNMRSTDLQAHLGRSQLRGMAAVVTARQRHFERYRRQLPGFFCQQSATAPLSSLAFGTLVANRAEVFAALREAGIESRPLICGNIGRQPFWLERFPPGDLPRADTVHDHGLYLPNHATLTEAEIDRVCAVFSAVARPWFFDDA
jgi:CDP-6-deoxy-D-xylo-4-hexulose-3-dehydrase